jgi:hypothetical protein
MFPLKCTTQRSLTWCEHTPSRKQRDRMAEKQRIKKLKADMRKQVNQSNKKLGY